MLLGCGRRLELERREVSGEEVRCAGAEAVCRSTDRLRAKRGLTPIITIITAITNNDRQTRLDR